MTDQQTSRINPRPEAPDSAVHYDASPGVFELLLDRNMNYSSGYYPDGGETLDVGQVAKMELTAGYLALSSNHHVLDLGCGWGGPALYYAEKYGCRVTGVNLSPVQRDFALAWADRRGLRDLVQVEVCDVMQLPYPEESFDRIIFFESIIHMPDKDAIFARCAELLKPNGRIFIQESCYDRESMRDRYLSDRGFDEVNRAFGYAAYMLSGGAMLTRLEEAGLVPLTLENISTHYVRTLSQWLDNLDRHEEAMRALSEATYMRLRRYLMIALATYRSGGTICHMITAEKRTP
jgi:cyclopropane-fatty-acyl-phospholipid synthase